MAVALGDVYNRGRHDVFASNRIWPLFRYRRLETMLPLKKMSESVVIDVPDGDARAVVDVDVG